MDAAEDDEIRSKIRPTLLRYAAKSEPLIAETGIKGDRRKSRRTSVYAGDDLSDEDEQDAKHTCLCAKKLRSTFKRRLRKFNEVSATNLKIRTGPEAGLLLLIIFMIGLFIKLLLGLWDSWGLYYCSSRFGRQKNLNSFYFSLVALFVISQGNMLNLIYYMNLHGGLVFLFVLVLVYFSLGYPMYMVETMMGQYSGRKPLIMLRFMMPALTGIGPALYLRTIIKAVNALGTFIYCAFMALSLFFCRPTGNTLIYRFLEAERRNRKFLLFLSNQTKEEAGTLDHDVFQWWWLILATIGLLLLVAQNLKLFGEIAKVLIPILILGIIGYLIIGLSRISDAKPNSVVFIPLKRTFAPKWKSLFKGQAWLDAIIFVVQSLELGTLVHPYLGSKNFFHYRCHRDGIYLVLLAILWNIAGATAALAWLGYVGVNETQMKTSTDHLFGHYGLIIVYMLKHLQAEMTQSVQGDVLFFNACFYSIIGVAALCALIVYIIIIVDCSFPESGQWVMKMAIMVIIVCLFGLFAPLLVMQDEGLRRLIFINFYVHKSWSVFFIIGCYFTAVAFGHDLGKFIHDFLNIIHIKGYQSRHHSYNVPRTLRYFVLLFLILGMISYMFTRPYPHEGQTDWSGNAWYLGVVFSFVPLLVVVSVVIYHVKRYRKEGFKPHRDWFKNKHHASVCFFDFAHFKAIAALRDPDPEPIGDGDQ